MIDLLLEMKNQTYASMVEMVRKTHNKFIKQNCFDPETNQWIVPLSLIFN